ncbi:MAG: glycerate kinase [Rhodococcus sp. (in: high G+C Gram-positive bacteria)]
MTKILLSPDKFKGSLTAVEVADALAAGLLSADPSLVVESLPVADGGDGTVAAVVAAGWESVALSCVGPTGAATRTTYARRGSSAVAELASAVGLQLQSRLDPLDASTYGLGTVVAHALDHGADHVVLGLGGSASTDGGAGMLQALGARILDAGGNDVPRGGGALRGAVRLDTSNMHPALRRARIQLACDVDNPLLGPTGAASVYGPQKGAGPQDVRYLEHAMRQWAHVVRSAIRRDLSVVAGAGAAGGTGFGLLAVLGADIRPGIDTVLDLIEFHRRLASADLVVTGEGSLDEQSLHGKAPIGVASAARSAGVPVVTVSGRQTVDAAALRMFGIVDSYALTDLEPDPAVSMRDAADLLHRVGEFIALSRSPFEEGVS